MNKIACKMANQHTKEFVLPELPFGKTDLEPFYSEKLLNLHYGKHHQAYVTNLNNLIKDSDFIGNSLEEIMHKTANDASKAPFFNNAAQIWNHSFFWYCMKKDGGGVPTGVVLDKINEAFGDYNKFKEEFITKATKVFGSGWCWLVVDKAGKLAIVTSSNAACPITDSLKPIMTVDVWEHAYYPDYENKRQDFVTVFLSNLVNWDFVKSVFNGECSEL